MAAQRRHARYRTGRTSAAHPQWRSRPGARCGRSEGTGRRNQRIAGYRRDAAERFEYEEPGAFRAIDREAKSRAETAIAEAADFLDDPKGLARRIATTYAVLNASEASRD